MIEMLGEGNVWGVFWVFLLILLYMNYVVSENVVIF